MNPYGPVALALGLIALSIGLWELSWFRRSGAPGRKTFPAFSTHQIWCIACSAALALANGVGAMMGHEGKDFYSDLCTVARCLWVYHYVQLLMAFFDPRGNGGRHELIVRTGETLEKAKLPVQSIPPPFRCFFGCKGAYTPGRAFMFSTVQLIELSIAGLIFLSIVKVTLVLEGKYYDEVDDDEEDECPDSTGITSTIINIASIFVNIMGVAGMVVLTGLLEPHILPGNRANVAFRHNMFLFILPFQAAVQNALVFGIILPGVMGKCEARNLLFLVVAIEMVIFQVNSLVLKRALDSP